MQFLYARFFESVYEDYVEVVRSPSVESFLDLAIRSSWGEWGRGGGGVFNDHTRSHRCTLCIGRNPLRGVPACQRLGQN